jgi:hypothetical protein
MSLLYFLQLDLFSLLTIAACICLVCLFHFGIGNYFSKTAGFYTCCLIGLILNSSLSVIIVSFNASLVKYQIFIVIIISATLTIKKFINQASNNIKIKFEDNIFIFLSISVSLLTFNELNILNFLPFNGHENYYWGISAEIFKAEYSSRLRFFDNYPYTWSKFHFFNGSMTAVLQALVNNKNYATFCIAKGICLSLFFVVIFENILVVRSKIKDLILIILILSLFIVYVNPFLFNWSYFGSSYSSIFLLIIAIIFIYNGNTFLALLFILTFSLSTSRSLLPGLGLAIYVCIKYLDEVQLQNLIYRKKPLLINLNIKEFNKFLAFLILMTAILVMIFSGSSKNNAFIDYSLITFYGISQNFFNESWLYLLAPTLTRLNEILNTSSYHDEGQNFSWYIIFYSFILIFKVCNIKFKHFSKIEFNINPFLLFILFEALIILFIAYKDLYKAMLVIFYFLIPSHLLFLLTPQRLKNYFFIFVIISIGQLFVFKATISTPNWHNIEWLIIFAFIYQVNINYKNKVNQYLIPLFIILFISMHLFVKSPIKSLSLLGLSELYNLPDSNKIVLSSTTFKEIQYVTKKTDCVNVINKSNYFNELSLLASLMGHRSYFHENGARNYTTTLDFVNARESVDYNTKNICD